MKTPFQSGKYAAICDVCGFRFYNDMLKKDWRSLMVCKQDYESRHPQDFIRGAGSAAPTPVPPLVCTANGTTSIVDFMVVGCVKIGFISPSFNPSV